MADKLIITESDRYRFRIQWELDDGDDLGAYLCQSKNDGKGTPPKDRGDWEHWAACKAVRNSEGVGFDDGGAWWESFREANAALRIAKEAIKQDRPLPEWAEKALAEGWKAPKGWKA